MPQPTTPQSLYQYLFSNPRMRYTSDLTDNEWNLIAYCFPKPGKKGRLTEPRSAN